MTVSDAISLFLTDARARKLSPNTIVYYTNQLAPFGKALGSKSIRGVVATDIRALVADASPKSAYHRYRVLKRLYAFLKREEVIIKDPTVNMKPPKVPQKVVRGLSPHDVERCYKAVSSRKDYCAIRDTAIFAMLVSTGIRANELCTLKESHLDLEQRMMLIDGKGGKQRVVPLPAKLMSLLLRYKLQRQDSPKTSHRECPYFFRARYGTALTTGALGQLIVCIGKRAGLHLHPHKLRHTFATLFMSHDGADVLTLQAICGWEQVSMAQRYAKAQLPKMQRSMDSFSPANDF